jgi:hypothetical protein
VINFHYRARVPCSLTVPVVFESECSKRMFLSVSEICCKCFHMDTAKVDRNISYVAMAIHVCCKAYVSNVSSIFQTYVESVFIWMLHMFHKYVASVLSGC